MRISLYCKQKYWTVARRQGCIGPLWQSSLMYDYQYLEVIFWTVISSPCNHVSWTNFIYTACGGSSANYARQSSPVVLFKVAVDECSYAGPTASGCGRQWGAHSKNVWEAGHKMHQGVQCFVIYIGRNITYKIHTYIHTYIHVYMQLFCWKFALWH